MGVSNLLKLAMEGPLPPDEVDVLNLEGKPVKRIKLPDVFKTPVRPDLIQRAFLAAFTAKIQPQGRNPMAGKRTTAQSWGVGYGVARVPRVKGSRRAAFAPMTVGGRRAHPPRVEKVIREKVNRKERILAVKSAISATAIREWVELRGHKLPSNLNLPIVVSSEIEELRRTYDAKKLLIGIGLWKDLLRSKKGIRIRA
ncbi:MAG: 50S ribosomal protein L4, partial [Candidatus Nezhaarchaeales archaeon]